MYCLPSDVITLQFNMILHILDTTGNKQEILSIVKSTLVQCTCDYGMNKMWAMFCKYYTEEPGNIIFSGAIFKSEYCTLNCFFKSKTLT